MQLCRKLLPFPTSYPAYLAKITHLPQSHSLLLKTAVCADHLCAMLCQLMDDILAHKSSGTKHSCGGSGYGGTIARTTPNSCRVGFQGEAVCIPDEGQRGGSCDSGAWSIRKAASSIPGTRNALGND